MYDEPSTSPAGPLRLQKAPMSLNWVLRMIFIWKGKTEKAKYFLF